MAVHQSSISSPAKSKDINSSISRRKAEDYQAVWHAHHGQRSEAAGVEVQEAQALQAGEVQGGGRRARQSGRGRGGGGAPEGVPQVQVPLHVQSGQRRQLAQHGRQRGQRAEVQVEDL